MSATCQLPVPTKKLSRYFFAPLSLLVLYLMFFLLLFQTPLVLAHDITEFEVSESDGIFYINASMVLSAPAPYVHAVLTDYVHIYRLNPSIIESEVLNSANKNTARIRTKVIGCVLSYCQEIERVEDVQILPSGTIQALIVAEFSQFKSGFTLWQVQSIGENTKLSYRAEMEPDFFIPPLIGTAIVKNKLRKELTTSFARLEKIARIQSERDWNPDWTPYWALNTKLDNNEEQTLHIEHPIADLEED